MIDGAFQFPAIPKQIVQAGIHMFHEDKERGLAIHHLQKIVLHLYDVGVVQLRNDAQLAILVLRVLHDLLHCEPFLRPFIHHLHHQTSTK